MLGVIVNRRIIIIVSILLIISISLMGCEESNIETEGGGIEGYIYKDLNDGNSIDYVISGEVKNDISLEPVFAKIEADLILTYSNQTGYFKIVGLKEGDYEVSIVIPIEGDYNDDFIVTTVHVDKDKITKINYSE